MRWLDYAAARVEVGGRPAVLGIALDVTEARERELALEAFARVSVALRRSEELKEMMEYALEAALEVLEAPAGSLLLYDPETGRLEAVASRGWAPDLPPPPSLDEASLVQQAFQGQVMVSPNLREDPRVRAGAKPFIPEGWSGAALPLMAGKEAVGVLTLAWPPPRVPTPKEVGRAELIAETIGNAVRRASLRKKLSQRLEYLEALRAVDLAIVHSLELAPSLEVFLDQVMRLPLDAAALFLYRSKDRVLELKHAKGFLSPKKALPHHIPLGQGTWAGPPSWGRWCTYPTSPKTPAPPRSSP